jgi:hypothetical protein
MKRLLAFVSLCAMASLAACSPIGDGTRESCTGPYTGTFKVDSGDQGTLEGRILASFGDLDMQMTPEPELQLLLTYDTDTGMALPDVRVTADVMEDGAVTNRGGIYDLVGTFNLDDCEASGTWGAGEFLTNGTWRLDSGHSAY